MSKSLRRVGNDMPLCGSTRMEPSLPPMKMTINDHLEHFEAVCEDKRGHPDEQKSPTSWYDMPLCVPMLKSTTGWSQNRNQSQLPPFELPISFDLKHFEAVAPRVRLFSVMVPKPANIQIAK
ncbi:Hypothetical predicted protein [Mytilus galloprovincialis]|uniref:Uncharacterized protein n=1 Tax=Mytilus galloprovincialis TaxID=29158 RepID=A0A8B6C3J6_MYTGA|nr:Hypothetical predicted protein [Mytilus galloprovincialis]